MKYTEAMILRSDSGYCMPFEEVKGKDVELTMGYGEQKHPVSGDTFFNHGIDFNANHYVLCAVASGTVSGIGSDSEHGIYQTIRYGGYEVTYGNLSNLFVNFGQMVKAGQMVAMSGDNLHMEVKFDGEEMNPIEFLTMLYGNLKAMQTKGQYGGEDLMTFEMALPTNYEKEKREIEELMLRFLPFYFSDLQSGLYAVPEHTEQSLRNIFAQGMNKHYFFESMPSIINPLGLGQRSMPLACKVQNLLIADFLNYLALRHEVYLSGMSEALKKKPMKKH